MSEVQEFRLPEQGREAAKAMGYPDHKALLTLSGGIEVHDEGGTGIRLKFVKDDVAVTLEAAGPVGISDNVASFTVINSRRLYAAWRIIGSISRARSVPQAQRVDAGVTHRMLGELFPFLHDIEKMEQQEEQQDDEEQQRREADLSTEHDRADG